LALSLLLPGAADEEATQRAVAGALGMPHVVASLEDVLGGDSLLLRALELSATTSGPPANLLEPAYDRLARTALEQGVEVLLTGEGGDEWLMPHHLVAADRLLALDARAVFLLWRAWHRYFATATRRSSARGVLWTSGLRPLLRAGVGSLLQRFAPERFRSFRRRRLLAPPTWLLPDEELRRALIEWAIDVPLVDARSLFGASRRELLEHPAVSLAAESLFEAGKRHGSTIATPLLDSDLVGFLYRVSPTVLIEGGRGKALAWQLLARSLQVPSVGWPATVFGDTVWEDVLRREAQRAYAEIGGVRALDQLGIAAGDELGRAVGEPPAGVAAHSSFLLCQVFMLEMWLRSRILSS
jgi:asparagine synthetase B (glutamine-hydrolysing)